MSEAFRKLYIGTRQEILTEETIRISGEPYTVGYTKEYIRAALPGEYPVNTAVSGILKDRTVSGILLLRPETK